MNKYFQPGTWVVDDDERRGMEWNRHVVEAENPDNRICFMAHSGGRDPEADEDKAFLIAEAPSMLNLLRRFVALPSAAWHPARHAAEEMELMQEATALIKQFGDNRS